MRMVLAASPNPVALKDKEGRYREANAAFLAWIGRSRHEVVGRLASELLPRAEAEMCSIDDRHVLQTGQTLQRDVLITLQDGPRWMNIIRTPARDLAGEITGVLCTCVDVSARKRAEDELRESQLRMANVLEGTNVGIWQWNVHSGEVIVNRQWAEMIGYSLEELSPLDIEGYRALCHPEDLRRAEQLLQRHFRGELPFYECECRVRHKDGRWIWTHDRGKVASWTSDGGALQMCGTHADITQRKQMEEDLRLSKEELEQHVVALQSSNQALEEFNQMAESAVRAKSAFLANMSHEIRTPMTAILGFADVLLEEAETEDAPNERVEALHTIQRNGQYLLELINDILDLSKVESGKLDVEHVACRPIEVVHEVLRLMQVRADSKGLRLGAQSAGPLPETVYTDPLRLRQILINLVGNAIKFTEVGEVRLVTRFVQRCGRSPCVQFDVIDTGIGMNQEQMARLFSPFCQAETSTSRKYGGTGLGLAISRRLCQLLGGDLSVSSSPGVGSTFSVTVDAGAMEDLRLCDAPFQPPVALGEPTADAAPDTQSLQGRILLAEDGPDNQRLIAFLLRKAGAEVVVAENGDEACQKALAASAAGQPYDLILMDMQMPVMDGYEATRRLRAAGLQGPIMALTASAMQGDEEACRMAGCNSYVAKPIDRPRLLAAIVAQLQRHKPERPVRQA